MSGENRISRFVRRAETTLRGRVRSIAFASLIPSFLLYLGSQTASAAVSFSVPVSYDVGTRPLTVVVADFDDDGRPDLAVANAGSSNISILMGNGDGTFQAAVNHGLSQPPTFLAVGDFNGDHRPDLVVGTMGESVSILLGNGDGSFQSPMAYPGGTAPEYISVADLNGDGRADLLVSSQSGVVSTLLGNGDGTFQSPTVTVTPGNTAFVAVGDFNGDGFPDLVTGYGSGSDLGLGALFVLLGNGDGSFQPPTVIMDWHWPRYLIASDLNNDGKLDLVVEFPAINDVNAYFIDVLFGNGDGTFNVSSSTFGVIPYSIPVAIGDADGDHHLDSIGSGHFPAAAPFIWFGLSERGHYYPQPCTQSSDCILLSAVPSWLATGDLNNDGALDLIVTNPVNNSVDVLLNSIAVKSTPLVTTTTLSVAPSNTVGAGTSVTLTAQVAHGTGAATPAGTVTFFNGKTPLNRTPAVVNSSGVAMFSTGDLGGGAYSVTATYSGDSNYHGSTSPVVSLSVVDFTLTASPTTVAVSAAGGSGTTTLIVTPLGGFNETLTYTCAGLPAEATCAFAAGSAANLETLTIQTTGDSARLYRSPFYKGRGSSFAMLVAGLLGLLVLPVRSRHWHPRTTRLLGVIAILGVSVLPACGGGSTTPTNPGTPTGTSKVTVTAASSGKYVLSHPATVTLTIK